MTERDEYPCEVCKKTYKQTEFMKDENLYFSADVNLTCPNCHYNKDYEKNIHAIIENIEAKISSEGHISFNTQDITRLVNKEIKKIWPKPGRQK